MYKYVGIWIDHSQAIVVAIIDKREEISYIRSNAANHHRMTGGSRSRSPFGPQEIVSDKHLEQKRQHHLHEYYHRVIDAIRGADSIYVFGPGEAKIEFVKALKKSKSLAPKVSKVAAAGKMTQRQIVAKVRTSYA